MFVLSHMGLAQQLSLANHQSANGVDYILGADTHKRIRAPLLGEVLQGHVSPTVEGRAVATDAPADLLSQVDGTSYRFM